MSEYTVDLGIPVPSEFAADVCDRLKYAHPGIETVEVVPEDTRHVRLTSRSNIDIRWLQPVLAANAKEMLEAGLEGLRVVLYDRRDKVGPPQRNVFDDLIDRGWLVQTTPGSYAKRGPVHRLMSYLDRKFRDMSVAGGAEEMEFSSFMSVEVLRKAGHLNAFPQHITFPTHLSEDLEYIKEVARTAREQPGDLESCLCGHFESNGQVLAPAVCYHLYSCLSGQTIDKMFAAAASNKCYRYEAGRLEGLTRLWEFTMREWIFVGAASVVKAARAEALKKVWQLAEDWNLHAWVENANDPFFVGEFASRAAFQRNREMKYELRLSVAGEFSVAATSFNIHSTTFGKSFGISLPNGRPACSACCAWGEERWLIALFSQFGLDPNGWPDELSQVVWRYGEET